MTIKFIELNMVSTRSEGHALPLIRRKEGNTGDSRAEQWMIKQLTREIQEMQKASSKYAQRAATT